MLICLLIENTDMTITEINIRMEVKSVVKKGINIKVIPVNNYNVKVQWLDKELITAEMSNISAFFSSKGNLPIYYGKSLDEKSHIQIDDDLSVSILL